MTNERLREFYDHGNHFLLLEENSWRTEFNHENGKFKNGKVVSWSETRIIVTKLDTIGLQIVRFYGQNKEEMHMEAYCGVYLKPEEWKIIIERMGL